MSFRVIAKSGEGAPDHCAQRVLVFAPASPSPFWEPMSVSPPRSPTIAPSMCSSNVSSSFMRMNALSLKSQNIDVELPLSNVIHTWGVTEEEMHASVYVYFEEVADDLVAWKTAHGTRISKSAVLPRPMFADSLSWMPLMSATGSAGYAYSLRIGGEPQVTFEVFDLKIVVVHADYSPLAAEAQIVPPATRLVFEEDHVARLQTVIRTVLEDDDMGYVPTSELLIGHGIDKLVLQRRTGWASDVEEEAAQRAWARTKSRLKELNTFVVRGIQAQNEREFYAARVSCNECVQPNLVAVFGQSHCKTYDT